MNDATTANFTLLRATRSNMLKQLNGLSLAQLNAVPSHFNNNLIWNAGHVVATMELLTYGLAGLKTPSGREFIDRYRKGSRPEGPVTQEEVEHIIEALTAGVDRLAADLETLDWTNFKNYLSSYGVTLADVDGALNFNGLHEAMHLGAMIALRKLV